MIEILGKPGFNSLSHNNLVAPVSDQFKTTDDEVIRIDAHGKVVVATLLEAEVTMFTLPDVRAALNEAIATKPEALVLDVSQTQYLDSSGIAVIFKTRHEVLAYSGIFCVAGLKGSLLKVMEKVLRKDDIKFYDSLDSALAALS